MVGEVVEKEYKKNEKEILEGGRKWVFPRNGKVPESDDRMPCDPCRHNFRKFHMDILLLIHGVGKASTE